MKHYYKQQLDKRYSKEIEDYHCINYFDFMINCTLLSSSPENTFKNYYLLLNREGRKDFLCELLTNFDNKDCKRLVHFAIKYL